MRKILLLLLVAWYLPCVGCGGGPDPQDREDFIDTTDPGVAADMLGEDPPPSKPSGGP